MMDPPSDVPGDSLRAQRQPAAGSKEADPKGDGAPRAQRILVVDDLVDAADTLAVYLRILGYDVRTAYDGQIALHTAAEFLPQIVLLDIALPKLDGYRVAEQLRQHDALQSACLIAISGYGQAIHVNAARQAGFDHHFLKPVDVEKLVALLLTVR